MNLNVRVLYRQHAAATVHFAGPRQDVEGRCSTQGSEDPVAATHSTHSASAALALSSVWAGGAYTGT